MWLLSVFLRKGEFSEPPAGDDFSDPVKPSDEFGTPVSSIPGQAPDDLPDDSDGLPFWGYDETLYKMFRNKAT